MITKKEINQFGLKNRVKKYCSGSIEDLSIFSNEHFNAVLC
jgi:hypothetical protein